MRTLQSELIEKGLYQKPKKKRPHKRKRNLKKKPHTQANTMNSNKNTEKLSRQDWEEIMGIRRPKYRRSRGAFRQL